MKYLKSDSKIKELLLMVFLLLAGSGFILVKNDSPNYIPVDKAWSERMALSIIKRNPQSWLIDADAKGERKWEYTQGLVLKSFEKLYEITKNEKLQTYIEQYVNHCVNDKGNIEGYDIDEFNIDKISPGRVLFKVYDRTHQQKYARAIETLRRQLQWQPRTTEGGFWHKLKYPWQMWLDGIYMGSPFYAEYALRNNETKAFDDIANQIILIEKHSRDEKTGLMYHGWDESKIQSWANSETGTSPNFWGRADGWYAMAIVDVLDYFPVNHPRRPEIIAILGRLIDGIERHQDPDSGVWYQVLDKGKGEGNFLESSASCMFVYAIAKSVNKMYIDSSHLLAAARGYQGLLKNFIEVDKITGEVSINKACAVAGLGGVPYRDGTFKYYINEPIKSNDAKAEGCFILASLELGK